MRDEPTQPHDAAGSESPTQIIPVGEPRSAEPSDATQVIDRPASPESSDLPADPASNDSGGEPPADPPGAGTEPVDGSGRSRRTTLIAAVVCCCTARRLTFSTVSYVIAAMHWCRWSSTLIPTAA